MLCDTKTGLQCNKNCGILNVILKVFSASAADNSASILHNRSQQKKQSGDGW